MKNSFLLAAALMFFLAAEAQHDHGQHNKADTVPASSKKDTTAHDHHIARKYHAAQSAGGERGHGSSHMSHAFSRNLPMTRNGSGTSWLPDNSQMYGYMFHSRQWMYMVHGNIYLRYNKQDLLERGSRGDSRFDAPNMVMLMGQRNVGEKGLFHFNVMVSLDPITIGAGGYPLLFQTGETYMGKPLVDRQHPHDLISELSVSYAHALSPKSDLFFYLGYPGEPALGPAAYVHRPSGMFNPDAPLSHHWIDATHITFGVATLGLRYGKWKIEASSFTGREPGENRYNFDQPRFDSWSGRLSFNPSARWAMQVSHGFIREPESLHPGQNVARTTASVHYSKRGYSEQFSNFTALWGMNKTEGHHGEHALLAEGSYHVRRKTLYGRYEWVQKSVEELHLSEGVFGHDAIFPVHAFTIGGSYDVLRLGSTTFSLGTQFSIYSPDKRLSTLYGDNPFAGEVYLRIFPRAAGQRSGNFYLPY